MNKNHSNDKELIEQVIKKNPKAIRIFYQKFKPKLKKFITKKAQTPADAEDIVQETLISAVRALPGFQFKASVFSWLCSIAKHELVDFYRKKKIKTVLLKSEFLETIASKALSPEANYLKNELKLEIKKVLKNLSEGYFKILRLKYIDQLTMATIAEKMNLTIKAVESRLSRAREKFKQEWQKQTSKELLNSPF